MGFLTSIASAVVKTALTPVSVIRDAVDVAKGEEPKNTKDLFGSIDKDLDAGLKSLEKTFFP